MKTKTLNFEETKKAFVEFALSNEEMIHVRGGGEPTVKTSLPPIKIWHERLDSVFEGRSDGIANPFVFAVFRKTGSDKAWLKTCVQWNSNTVTILLIYSKVLWNWRYEKIENIKYRN